MSSDLCIMPDMMCPLFPILFLSIMPSIQSHSRWTCPEPRSPSTGIKNGPCGEQTLGSDDADDASTTIELKPGPLRVIFEESIHHTGAPFRVSLSDDGSDDNSCVLLDHIPHNDCCRPSFTDPTTYTRYVLTVTIPNVICDRCSLHLSNQMADKIGTNGAPDGIGCTDPGGTCFSVYHSCTKPFRIAGENDAVPRKEYSCPDWRNLNEQWPTRWVGDDGESVDAAVSGVYRRESSIWSMENNTLITVPSQYQEDAGGLCGEKNQVDESDTNSMASDKVSIDGNSNEAASQSTSAADAMSLFSSVVMCFLCCTVHHFTTR